MYFLNILQLHSCFKICCAKRRVYDSLLEIIDTKTLLEKVIPRHATGVLWRGILFENKLYTIFQAIISGR